MKNNNYLVFILFLILGLNGYTQVEGRWVTYDDEINQKKSIIEIYKKGDEIYGKIVKLLQKPQDSKCEECEGEDKGKLLVGMEIIKNLKKSGNEYKNGTILDPNNGKTYDCKIWIDNDNPNVLNVRGYIAVFFRTQTWKRDI